MRPDAPPLFGQLAAQITVSTIGRDTTYWNFRRKPRFLFVALAFSFLITQDVDEFIG